ncbi:MAG: hypothetical protein JWN10_2796 [Solirubrobacterales bacterium]|nr:hypothetical protein [Solirubrobacterales bacterium]
MNTSRCLPIDGVVKSCLAHLLKHSTDSLAQLLPKAQVRTDASDPRITSKARRIKRIAQVDETGKASGAPHLDPIVEDLDADMVAREAIGPVNNRIDQALEPSVLRDKRHIPETSRCANERPPDWLKPLDSLPRLEQLMGNGAFDVNVLEKLLASARPALSASVSQNPNKCLGQRSLRVLRKEQGAGDGQRAIVGKAAGT